MMMMMAFILKRWVLKLQKLVGSFGPLGFSEFFFTFKRSRVFCFQAELKDLLTTLNSLFVTFKSNRKIFANWENNILSAWNLHFISGF